MFPGQQKYPEGHFQPARGGEHNWHVWCMTGALQILGIREFIRWLAEHPDNGYTVNFANGSAARIKLGDPLWEMMTEIAKDFSVEVFTLSLLNGRYVPWSGGAGDLRAFDAIKIKSKEGCVQCEPSPDA